MMTNFNFFTKNLQLFADEKWPADQVIFLGGEGGTNVFLFNGYMERIFTLCIQIRESSYLS